jgi:adenine-specific DNA-methyltransferase
MMAREDVEASVAELLARTEARRVRAATFVSPGARRQLGQVFTPREVAERIAAQPRLDQTGTLRVLDPGAGAGVLGATLAARAMRERPDLAISITAVEVDRSLHEHLRATLEDCRQVAAAAGVRLSYELVSADFIPWGVAHAVGSLAAAAGSPRFDVVIQNPPYGKVQRGSSIRRQLARLDIEVPNLYAAFLAIGTRLLGVNGQLVAITPRSFCNGTYFRGFRRDLLHEIGIDRIAVFHERSSLFAESAVLQETMIFSGTSGRQPGKLVIAAARGYADGPHERLVPYDDVVQPGDPELFLHIPTDDDDDVVNDIVSRLPATLPHLPLQVSTGRVVDFRAKEYLRSRPQADAVPLIYPHHFRNGRVAWPREGTRKPNAIVWAAGSEKLLLPSGTYVLVKRFSAKEETRRVVACACRPEDIAAPMVGFENHVDVFHWKNEGIDPQLAVGLSAWLNSSILDRYFRQFSGHTQINAADLRNLRYPDRSALAKLGSVIDVEHWPEQLEIDELVQRHVLDGLPASASRPRRQAQHEGENSPAHAASIRGSFPRDELKHSAAAPC